VVAPVRIGLSVSADVVIVAFFVPIHNHTVHCRPVIAVHIIFGGVIINSLAAIEAELVHGHPRRSLIVIFIDDTKTISAVRITFSPCLKGG
jgi:hypothetical protein